MMLSSPPVCGTYGYNDHDPPVLVHNPPGGQTLISP